MKTIKSLVFSTLAALALVFSSCAQKGDGSYTNVKVADLKAKLGDDIIILDVRTPEETSEGYIEGAVIININDDNFAEEVSKLNKEKPVYVYCRSGSRSAKASKIMIEQGFKHVYNVEGGFNAWKDAGYPQVK